MVSTQTSFQELLKKEVTRKEFLLYLGLAVIAVMNIAPILRMFGKHPDSSLDRIAGSENGIYGGRKRKTG